MCLPAAVSLEFKGAEGEEFNSGQSSGRKDVLLGACLEPDWGHTQDFLAQDACHSCHSPPVANSCKLVLLDLDCEVSSAMVSRHVYERHPDQWAC